MIAMRLRGTAFFLCLLCMGTAADAGGVLVGFDVPGTRIKTFPTAIDSAEDIAGYFLDRRFIFHGFVRAAAGGFATFDVSLETVVTGIADDGSVTGFSRDVAGGTPHGFVRAPSGVITSFDAPDAGLGDRQGTLSAALSNRGELTGSYIDDHGHSHGFFRTP